MADGVLAGWLVELPSDAAEPVAAAAAELTRLGARPTHAHGPGDELRVVSPAGIRSAAAVPGWRSGDVLRERVEELGEPELAPEGDVLTAYAAQRLPALALAGGGALDQSRLVEELLVARAIRGRIRPELLRCRDGWVVARFRDDDERLLLAALVGPPEDAPADHLVAQARIARLLVARVRAARRAAAADVQPVWAQTSAAAGGTPRVIDWSVLWAGPFATGELRATGAQVTRVEHPRRRDGLLRSKAGARWWHALNADKELALLDARDVIDHATLAALIANADILVTSMTPRAFASLGFDDPWRERHAPTLLHVELVGFDHPHADVPALGEHAAAESGLLWRGDDRPATPYSWPDPLLGAQTELVCRAWLATTQRRGGRIRLSLEQAASTVAPRTAAAAR